jgi:G6PDH family F420-dependent oxidoreductase
MAQLGYALSSEEHRPNDLVRFAQRAEEVGFSFALISDHFHPWLESQGQSPFVWSVIGAIAHATERLRLGTGVTCPIMRTHPAVIAQAAATAAAMMPGRFFLGVGTGEALNEHILGDHWPEYDVRLEMLAEAIDVIRTLWQGGNHSFYGEHFIVENAQLFTLPDEAPPIYMAAGGPKAAEAAGRLSDGLISTAPKETIIEDFARGGGQGKPRFGQTTVCWARSEKEAIETATKVWPQSALGGELHQVLPTVAHFEQAIKLVTKEKVAEAIVCGPDPRRHMESIQEFVDAGFDHIYIHQIGPDQEGFFDFYRREILPAFQSQPARTHASDGKA